MNIQKAIDIYLNWKKAHTNVAYDRYQVRLNQFRDYIGAKTDIKNVTGDSIINFHNGMENEYSLGTIAYSARILKNFFEFWKGRDPLLLNPKEIIPIRYTPSQTQVVSQEDFEDMNLALDERNFGDLEKKLVINLLWDTGMRISELADMKLSDISPVNEKGLRTAQVRTRKTMRYNLVVWGSKTNELLTKYLGMRLDMDALENNLLVNPKTYKRYTIRTYQRWIKEISLMAQIDGNISCHGFRHGKGHHILNTGGNVRDVQALLRHVKPESSFNYLQLNASQYLKVAEKYLMTA